MGFYKAFIFLLTGWLCFLVTSGQLVNCPRNCLCTTVPNSAIALVTNSFLRLRLSCSGNSPDSSIPVLSVNTDYLREFEFTGSDLQTLPRNLCNHGNIQYLDMSSNNISSASSEQFGCLPYLTRLQMAGNSFSELHGDIFKGLAVISTIDFSSNQISYIHPSTFHAGLSQLETVDLSKNKIQVFEPWPFLLPELIVFDLNSNSISSFGNSMNWTVEQSPSSIAAYISLQTNQFSSIALKDFGIYGFGSIQNLWYMRPIFGYFDLRNNPFICDCHIYEFVHYMSEISKTHPTKTSFDYQYYDVTCQSPTNLQGMVMLDLNYTEFICTDVSLCPSGCQCTFTPHINSTVVDCKSAGLAEMPVSLPEGVLVLYFQDNTIRHLPRREYLSRVSRLYLTNNLIDRVDEEALTSLSNVQSLNLAQNNLTSLPRIIVDAIDPEILNLGGNPFNCDCDTTWLAKWLRTSGYAGMDTELCENTTGVYFLDISDEGLGCIEKEAQTTLYITIAIVLVIIFFFLILLIIFRNYLKLLFYRYLNIHPFDKLKDDDSNSRYKDVYISTHGQSPDVRGWITQELTPKLEGHAMSFRVFLPSRDGGKSTSRELIAKRLKDSKRHLFVMTPEFNQSDWPMFEFRESALQDELGDGKRMIIILMDDDSIEKLDEQTKETMKKHVILKRSSRWFWLRLFYWMPVKSLGPLCCRCRKSNKESAPVGPSKPSRPVWSEEMDRSGTSTPVQAFYAEEDLAWSEKSGADVVTDRDIRRTKYPKLSPLDGAPTQPNPQLEDLHSEHEGSIAPSQSTMA